MLQHHQVVYVQSSLLDTCCAVWFAGTVNTAYRQQLKQDNTAITVVANLISGDTQGAGSAIAQASASNHVRGTASALTNAAALVRSHAAYSLDADMCALSLAQIQQLATPALLRTTLT